MGQLHCCILLFKYMVYLFTLLFITLLAVISAFSHQTSTITFVSAIWEDPNSPSFSQPSLLHSQLQRLLYIRQFLSMKSPLIIYGQARILKLMEMQGPLNSNLLFIQRDIQSLRHLNDTRNKHPINDQESQVETLSFLQILQPDYYKVAKLGLMDKLALLQDAKTKDISRSDMLVWLDAEVAYTFPSNMLIPLNQFAKPFNYWQSPWLLIKQQRNTSAGVKQWVSLDYFGGRKEALSTVASILQNWHHIIFLSDTSQPQQTLLLDATQRYSYLFATISHFNLTDLRNFTYYTPKLHLFEQNRHFQIQPNFIYSIQPDPEQTLIVVKQQQTLTFSQQKATYLRILMRKGQIAQKRQFFAAAMILLFIVNSVMIQIARKRWSSLIDSIEDETTMIDN